MPGLGKLGILAALTREWKAEINYTFRLLDGFLRGAVPAVFGEVAELVEGDGLLNRCRSERSYQGFESLPLRHFFLD